MINSRRQSGDFCSLTSHLYPGTVTETQHDATDTAELPRHRYTAQLAGQIERRWQQTWADRGTFHVPNPVGSLAPTDGTPI
ncbi:hypothetical protein HHM31_12345, partial [Staphylococcus capitis]|nr:hypothetical protein [Staphylococcus capitis]